MYILLGCTNLVQMLIYIVSSCYDMLYARGPQPPVGGLAPEHGMPETAVPAIGCKQHPKPCLPPVCGKTFFHRTGPLIPQRLGATAL